MILLQGLRIVTPKARALCALVITLLLAVWPGAGMTARVAAQGAAKLQWSRPIPVSGPLGGSWYPTIAADDGGHVYLFWGVSLPEQANTIYVSTYDGLAWSRPVDVLLGGPRGRVALDGRGQLRLLVATDVWLTLVQASASAANSTLAWGGDEPLNRGNSLGWGDMVVDAQGVAHALWFEKSDACEGCALVAYAQKGGPTQTSSTYRAVSDSELDARGLSLVRAPGGTLYGMWTAAGQENARAGVRVSVSANNGDTWLDQPRDLTYTDADILQPLLELDREGNLILIFNLSNKDETYYAISRDEGITWSDRAPVPGLFAGKPSTSLDYFASAHDTSDTIHLLAAGRRAKDQNLSALYHVSWDGKAWSTPDLVYEGSALPLFPAVTLSRGNQLDVSFATRSTDNLDDAPSGSYEVWYTTAQTGAEPATRVPLPTFTPQPTSTPAPTTTSQPTRRPSPTRVALSDAGQPPAAPQPDSQQPLLFGLVPVVAILAVVVILNSLIRRRR